MKRIGTATRVVNKFGAGKDGFTDGDVIGGVAATDLEAALFDNLQEEICNVIETAGLVLDGAVKTQLLTAIRLLSTPAGEVVFFARNTAPTGYLKANGALINRVTYATLFAAIGTTFGVGDGATTFALPDLRGEFVRGWDDGRGVDSGRAFGSAQKGSLLGYDTNNDGVWCATAVGMVTTAASQSVIGVDAFSAGDYAGAGLMGASFASSSGLPGDAGGQGASGVTRPRNTALLACIKY